MTEPGADEPDPTSPETVIVVGATGSFGRAIVDRLISDGYRVMAIGRNSSTLDDLASAHAAGGDDRIAAGRADRIATCIADLNDDAAGAAIAEALGDAVVRAVVHGPSLAAVGTITSIDPEALGQAVNLKVGGLLRLVRAADPNLVADSRIIAIGGHYGLEPTAYAAAAGVANAALIAAVRQLSLAYGPRRITAHTIAPGPADTDRLRKVAAARADRDDVSVEAVLDDMRAESSTGLLTTPEQVAWAVATLLAPEATAMTGTTLMLDSGRRRGLP